MDQVYEAYAEQRRKRGRSVWSDDAINDRIKKLIGVRRTTDLTSDPYLNFQPLIDGEGDDSVRPRRSGIR